MKVLFGLLGHETNTFAADKGDFKRWAPNGWVTGDDIFTAYDDVPDYPSGVIKAAKEDGVELIPTVALLNAGPLITKDALEYTTGTLLGYVEKYKDEIDGICMGLHGAGAAEGVDDLEGYILQKIRDIVGYEMPITVSLDLHGNITDDMVRLSNGLFGLKEYPHIDQAEAGYRAMKCLTRILRDGLKTETAVVHLPMFTNCCVACTLNMPMQEFKEYVKAYAASHPDIIEATYFHGFPYTDVPYAGSSVVVVTPEGKDPKKYAEEIARWIWDNRHKLDVELLSPAQAIDRALAIPGKGFVVINEASDNPGGGCPGNGTWLLAELIKRNVPRSIVGYIPDKEIVMKAAEAGIGGKVSGLLGGKTDKIHGAPIEIKDAEVLALSNGQVVYTTPMYEGIPNCYGLSARLRIGNVEVVVTEYLSQQTFDDRPFAMVGADINQYDIVGVKSTAHFNAFFKPRAKAIIGTNPPGIHTADYSLLPYKNIRRPIYPLDPDTQF